MGQKMTVAMGSGDDTFSGFYEDQFGGSIDSLNFNAGAGNDTLSLYWFSATGTIVANGSSGQDTVSYYGRDDTQPTLRSFEVIEPLF